VPGTGDTRFAPLADTAHAYVATTAFAALLESVLHEAHPPDPVIRKALLAWWRASRVRLSAEVSLVDLRDAELARFENDRNQLVSTTKRHYRCTRRWAEALHGRSIGEIAG
jgi:hypothetical protein